MAKTLSFSPPSSSVARLLDSAAVTRALSPVRVPTAEVRRTASDTACHRPLRSIKREVVLGPDTAVILDRLVDELRRATGTRLSTSHAVRAILLGLSPCMGGIAAQASGGSWRLPPNGETHHDDRGLFERRLADVIASAFLAVLRAA